MREIITFPLKGELNWPKKSSSRLLLFQWQSKCTDQPAIEAAGEVKVHSIGTATLFLLLPPSFTQILCYYYVVGHDFCNDRDHYSSSKYTRSADGVWLLFTQQLKLQALSGGGGDLRGVKRGRRCAEEEEDATTTTFEAMIASRWLF